MTTTPTQPEMDSELLTVEVRDGARVCVPRTLDYMATYVLLEQEGWFEDEMEFVRRYLLPGMKVVDIGANYGVYALSCARSVGANGAVWAVEPGQTAASYLRQSKAVNNHAGLYVIEAALSKRTGSIDLNEGGGAESNSVVFQPGKHVSRRSVRAYALDDAAREFGWNAIDLVKLDAKGEELNILEAGRRFFTDESPLVMFELKTINDVFNVELIKKFKTLGYRSFRLVPGMGVLTPLVAGERAGTFQLNLFCCKVDREAELVSRGLITGTEVTQSPVPEAKSVLDEYFAAVPGAGRFSLPAIHAISRTLGNDDLIYREGLGLFVHSQSTAHALPERARYLKLTHVRISDAIAQRETMWRNISAVRIMLALGYRERAAYLLKRLSDAFTQGVDTSEREPFLTTNVIYDVPTQDLPLPQALSVMVNEQLERSRAFSSAAPVRSLRAWQFRLEKTEMLRCGPRFLDRPWAEPVLLFDRTMRPA